MKPETLFQSLQAKLGMFTGDHLSPVIRYQDRAGNFIEKSLLEATLDEVAFAIQTLAAESSTLYQRRNALEKLYTVARERGHLGSDTVEAITTEVAP
jgi:hypothetical protein